MATGMEILLFGDQASEYHHTLKSKIYQKNCPLLSSFLERTCISLRQEVARQPRLVRRSMPSFNNLLDILDWHEKTEVSNPAIDSAICCITQIACLLSHYETSSKFVDPARTLLIGSCTGLLAAIVVNSSRGLSDLPVLGAIMVKIAFRVGLQVAGARDWVQSSPSGKKSWAGVVAGKDEDEIVEALERFNREEKISSTDKAYISAVGYQSLTISGPPSTLEKLAGYSDTFKGLSKVSLPVYGPYHAPHLYSARSCEKVVEPFVEALEAFQPHVPLLSSYSGRVTSETSTPELVKTAILEILRKPLYWSEIIPSAVAHVRGQGVETCTVLPICPANVGNGLVRSLEQTKACAANLDSALWTGAQSNLASGELSGKLVDSKIAIVGMAGRFPNADSHEAFWALLEKGTDTHKIIPTHRFDANHVDPSGKKKNTSHTPYGCFIDEPGLFDARFFSMSPREATDTDPMHRLALLTAYEALEQSGFTPNRTPSTQRHRVGTFYGQTSDDWREIQEAQNIDTYFIPGGVRAFAPGRINYYFKFSGPSYSVDTACSSSFAALQLAVTSLRAGDCDTAITGGMNVMTNPDIFSGLSRGQFLSKTGNCKTYDDGADGYCRGEGVSTLILKRMEDAEADKDNILGVILASATNHSADAVSITHPHAGNQAFLYQQILNRAGVDGNDIGYVEMHGTGTQAGDMIEMESVTSVFAAKHRKRRKDQPLRLGAVKANIGHGEAVSGVSALIKVLMMFEKNAIPPNCGIKSGKMNRNFPEDMAERNIHIPLEVTPFPRPDGGKRTVYVSNFSAAGGNTGVLLEDAPLVEAPQIEDPRPTQIITVTGKSKTSLANNIRGLLRFIDNNPNASVSSLAYTSTARRLHYNYRVAVTQDSLPKIKDALSSYVDQDISPISPKKPQVAFVFTGQGSHYPALGNLLFRESSQFQSDLLFFDEMVQCQGFPSFMPLIDGSVEDCSSLSPVVIQLACTCVQMAAAHLWMSWGFTPAAVLGHSLGEYAALFIAGVLSASDVIHLVGERAHELETQCTPGTHAMLAVADSVAKLEARFDGVAPEIACINSPSETVLGGSLETINRTSDKLSQEGIKNTKLQIPYAFHISQVDPILKSYETIAESVTFDAPRIPVISPLLGKVVREKGSFDANYLTRHARETVNFPNGIEAGINDNVINDQTIWIEIGPHPVCLAMIKKMLNPKIVAVPTLRRNENAWKTLSESLTTLYRAGLDVNWNEFHRDFNPSQQLLRLPSYAFDLKNFWTDYRGNWCLTKGDTSNVVTQAPEAKPKNLTTSVHRIVEESVEKTKATVVVESDINEPTLRKAVGGHMVNGTALCPSSLYADMAITVGRHLFEKLNPDSEVPAINVGPMEVDKSLIAKGDVSQLIRISGKLDKASGAAKLDFYSVSASGAKTADHATCRVTFDDPKALASSWKRMSFLVKSRIQSLLDGVHNGSAEKIRREMAYELFGSFVNYAQSYRGMEEVTMDSKEYEATARLSFQTTEEDGNFVCSPFWIDSIGHLSGFIVNVKEAIGSKTNVYVSHGWESMRFAKTLSKDGKYRSYVKMQPAEDTIMAGDVFVFEEDTDEIIGVFGGLKFKRIPRTILNTFLPPQGAASKGAVSKDANPTKQAPAKKPAQNTNKPKAKAASAPAKPSGSGIAARALDLVAGEIGMPVSELSDNVVFTDVGVDSLMSLTISAKLRESLDIEVSQTLFQDCPTVKDLQSHFSANSPTAEVTTSDSASDTADSSSGDESASSATGNDGAFTPNTEMDEDNLVETIRSIIAEKMEIPESEIVGQTDFASLGMDSLMTLTVLAELREVTGQDLSPDFFVENPSMEAVENVFNPKSKPTVPADKPAGKSADKPQSREQSPPSPAPSPAKPERTAKSLLLQGNPKTASKTLFLFPDGSGSASSYAAISKIDTDVAVYGLNCPFMEHPTEWTNGIAGVATLYKQEVQRRQPHGPYYLGGWSAGGVLGYEISLQLQAEGETVERLILLDSPCPLHLEPLPSRLHHFFDDIGLLGTGKGKAPSWLLPHFDSAIRALDEYQPAKMGAAKAPKVFAVWASDGVCGKPDDPKPEPQENDPWNMKWLLENRTDFGPNGWDALLGNDESRIECAVVKGGNHFTIMREPVVQELAALIKKGLQ